MKGMTYICGGKMTLKQIKQETEHYLTSYKRFSRVVVDIKKIPDGYHATFWVSEEDFTGGQATAFSKMQTKLEKRRTEIEV